MDRLVGVKFHTDIANRWLFMIQRKIMGLFIKLFGHVYGGRFFPDTVYIKLQ